MSKSSFERLMEAFNRVSSVVRPHLERVYKGTPADAVDFIKRVAADLTGRPVIRDRAPKIPPKRKGRDFKL